MPLKHPVNVAYEAATADLADTNIIDPFHLEAYQVQSVNYNRDVGVFPVLQRILSVIALAISATNNHAVELAMEILTVFRGCEMHMAHMSTPGDEEGIRRLGINLATDDLYTM